MRQFTLVPKSDSRISRPLGSLRRRSLGEDDRGRAVSRPCVPRPEGPEAALRDRAVQGGSVRQKLWAVRGK